MCRIITPISLVNGVYKFITKVPANQMSTTMEKIILKPQDGFVKVRQNFRFGSHC